MLSHPSGMTVSSRALIMLTDRLRAHRTTLGTRWRRRHPGGRVSPSVAVVDAVDGARPNPSGLASPDATRAPETAMPS